MATPTNAITVSDYMHEPEIVKSFVEVLGNDSQANGYIQSVLILVASDDKLMACTPRSIYKSAMRAASLGLSCDISLKQAWIIPYNKNIGTREKPNWIKEAQFQPHYKGLHALAMRTGKYWHINVSAVYEGQRVLENSLTGLHVVQEGNGFVGQPQAYNQAYVDVTTRRKKGMKRIGWIGYFKQKNGFEKSIYMSCAEIEDYAQQYVKEYDRNQNWHDENKRETMEMKTVFRQLMGWADLTGKESAKLAEALQADQVEPETIEAEEVTAGELQASEPQPEPQPEPEEMINPFDKGPIAHAANAWNSAPAQVRKDITKAIELGKLTNPCSKAAFKAWVANPNGEQQPA
jgi:phage RecT family recombinase